MLIPDNIEEFDSHGEYLLYHKFKNDKAVDDFYILHSVFTNYHLTNISGELDFLVLAPGLGIFAIEVKHGGIRRKQGTWIFEDRYGNINKKKKGPFSQVNDTMHSVRKFVLDKVSHDQHKYDRLKKILFGNGVAFTSMDSREIDFGPEALPWHVFTKESFRLPISNYIQNVSSGWHTKYKDEFWYDVNSSRPTKKDCELILEIIRGNFSTDYTEINRIADNEKVIEEFTKEQFQVLSFVNFNDRCLIEGQAGTGKTVLALELVKRRLNKNEKVGLFCFNKKLGLKLKRTIKKNFHQGEYDFSVGTLHGYMLSETDLAISEDTRSEFYSDTLPIEFLIQNEEISHSSKFDFLIIDEAQDLLSNYYLEVLDFILKGGLKDGKWVMFGDFSNQAIYVNNPFKALETLREKSYFTKLPLDTNCRNTKKIVNQNTLLTGIDLPKFTNRTLQGKSIDPRFPAKNKKRDVIENIIDSFERKKVPLDKITLLSPKKISKTCLEGSEYINSKRKWIKYLYYTFIQRIRKYDYYPLWI